METIIETVEKAIKEAESDYTYYSNKTNDAYNRINKLKAELNELKDMVSVPVHTEAA